MKKPYIFICGNFGYKKNQIDGQTIRTRQIKDILIERLGEDNIVYVDTSFSKSNPLLTFKKIKENVTQCSHLLILPGKNGLRVLLPFYIRWKRILKIDMRYIVIGGWLHSFLNKNKYYLNLCKHLDGVYVQTSLMKEKLKNIGLNKLKVLPNFRRNSFEIEDIGIVKPPIKLVYFSRITKEKGIELAIEAVEKIDRNNSVIKFDIYGPIDNKYKEKFKNMLLTAKSGITYKGIIKPVGNNIYAKLSKYDLMLFPTYYSGEGFPGAILDSFISGVPVLASNWRYNHEIIEDNITGKLFISKDIKDLTNKLEFLINNPELIYNMKKNCLEEAKKYDADIVIDKLIKDMKIKCHKNILEKS